MVTLAQVDVGQSLQDGFTTVLNFLPNLLAFLAILIIGYFVAKLLERVIDGVLERVGFDRMVERGGVKQALDRTKFDASDILAKIVFYAIMLFVLQMAFGVFGDNPISELLFGVIAFLPKIFVAILIIVIASAIAAAVRELADAAIGSLSYGRILANAAAIVIIGVGIFAALNQVEIAPAIVNGLFYALLAIVVGVTIVAVGGGGIVPMRQRWERALELVDDESDRIREQVASTSSEDVKQRAQQRKQQTSSGGGSVSGGSDPAVESQRSTTRLDRDGDLPPLRDEPLIEETRPMGEQPGGGSRRPRS